MVKVIFLKNVPKLGRRGDIKALSPGLVRHELFPSGSVEYATPENVAKFSLTESQKAVQSSPEQLEYQQQRQLRNVLERLSTAELCIPRRCAYKANEPDRMIGCVTARDVVQSAELQLEVSLHPSHLFMDAPITSFGLYKVPLNLRTADDKQIELTISIPKVRRFKAGRAYAH